MIRFTSVLPATALLYAQPAVLHRQCHDQPTSIVKAGVVRFEGVRAPLSVVTQQVYRSHFEDHRWGPRRGSRSHEEGKPDDIA